MATTATAKAAIPSHVDPALVVDFDYTNPPGLAESGDVYRAFDVLHKGPDIVWTPHHGGHWIATRAPETKWIQETHQTFSSTEKAPPKGSMPFMPPITCDPPEHSRYRAVLNPFFAKKQIEENYAPKARAVIAELIEALKAAPEKACEFVSAFSTVAPLMIFWDFVDLPYERREMFLGWGRDMAGRSTGDQRNAALMATMQYLGQLLDERMEAPGDDVFTGISQWRSNPRFQSRDELVGMAQLVFFGGQDTVASQIGFAMWRLCEQPELQQRLKDDPDVIPAAVEELLRRHGLSNTVRLLRHDVERHGAFLKEGDLIMTANALSGTDERAYPDAFRVDFDRGPVAYNSLGNGPHKCIGQHLARLELRLFLEEWAARMPIVRFDPAMPPPCSHAGGVIGVDHLHLAWD